jgi:S-adenosylmethionine:tRNA ribosyltransferase-isomerase
MKVTDFDYFLPENLIAERPLKERGKSRLLVLNKDGSLDHKSFSDLPSYLDRGDMLLLNNTKVFPARLTGLKLNGDKIDMLLVREKDDGEWEVLSKGNFTGTLKVSDELRVELRKGSAARFRHTGELTDMIQKYGNMPIPPYIKRPPDKSDKETYQTVYARNEGSIAAPTAGLHFSNALLEEISSRGIEIRELTLHVGIGTFRPIRTDNVNEHVMDAENFEMDKRLLSDIDKTKLSGKRIICVGTTTTRAIEGYMGGNSTVTSENGRLRGTTNIFIYPGHSFRAVDALVTNFHLPKSTPLMLASAIAGREKLMNAYREAIAEGYRFLSYGDAMLIL